MEINRKCVIRLASSWSSSSSSNESITLRDDHLPDLLDKCTMQLTVQKVCANFHPIHPLPTFRPSFRCFRGSSALSIFPGSLRENMGRAVPLAGVQYTGCSGQMVNRVFPCCCSCSRRAPLYMLGAGASQDSCFPVVRQGSSLPLCPLIFSVHS